MLRVRPNDADARYLRGVTLKELGRAVEAVESLDALLTDAPQYTPARYVRATLLYSAGDYAAAIDDLDAGLAAEPRQYGALLLRGLAARYEYRFDEALDFLTRVIEVRPEDGSTYFRRAAVFNDLGRTGEAAADLARGKSLL